MQSLSIGAVHCITLRHSVARPSPVRNLITVPPKFRMVLGCLRGSRWYTCDALLWFYVQLRGTSKDGLILATDWYLAEMTRVVVMHVKKRAEIRVAVGALLTIGCICLTCDTSWFEAGWICPTVHDLEDIGCRCVRCEPSWIYAGWVCFLNAWSAVGLANG